MFIRRGRGGGRRPLVASHLPIKHKATPAERPAQGHQGRIVETAGRYGLDAEAEVPVANRRSVWFVPALCLPQRKPVHIEERVLQSATGESVPVYVPNRGNGRAGRHMWVSADDRAMWQELIGEKTPLPTAPPRTRTT
ncbi:hypothetical protein [Streptomyces lavendofoliae]|uniref:hypothetical protein n=1 Tax=Streptomyces lavendofoliae TaxID=67314 RepID=UPI00300E9376